MQNILEALRNQGLQIYVTTAIGPQLLSDHSFNPPSKAVFQDNVLGSMGNILEFLDKSGYPLLVNVHPFKRYVATANPDLQILNFALFNYSNIMIVDGDRVYHNLFDAMFASLRAAVNKASKDTPFKRGLVISETGWPTAGFGTATSVPNAMTFNCKIIERIKKDLISTPVYIHSLFDERWKSTINEWDKYWGLLETDGRFKKSISYSVEFDAVGYCAYLDAENAMDPLLVTSIGVNTDKLLIAPPDSAENLLNKEWVAVLVPHLGLSSFVNQVRSNVKSGQSSNYGEVTCGGNALKFYAAARIRLIRKGLLRTSDMVMGLGVCLQVVKNKLAPSMKNAELAIRFCSGISLESEVFDIACEHGIIMEDGSNHFIEGEVFSEEAEWHLAENYEVLEKILKTLRSELFHRIFLVILNVIQMSVCCASYMPREMALEVSSWGHSPFHHGISPIPQMACSSHSGGIGISRLAVFY
ncbi:DNA recombination and repair protein RecA [Dillenia turbinata]|uniref:DNA recombination and repair protein RecA n=1 Tax=Dillenia turbinata TaxID=194707 RepID=A0AAN8WAW2_9MAGN